MLNEPMDILKLHPIRRTEVWELPESCSEVEKAILSDGRKTT